jgi:hypothetical protein
VAAPDAHSVEAALDAVPGVADARVVLDAAGGELRLVLDPGADERLVAPAVHRVLREGFGLGLDPRRLSVVEETEPEAAPPHLRLVVGDAGGDQTLTSPADLVAPPRLDPEVRGSAGRHPAGSHRVGGRATLGRLAVATDGLGAEVTVTLLLDGRELTATATTASTAAAVLRAVGAATTEAVRQACGDQVRVDLEDVRLVHLGEHEVAVVAVLWSAASGAERCIGASEVRDDPRQAVIRATLDAVNRRLALA